MNGKAMEHEDVEAGRIDNSQKRTMWQEPVEQEMKIVSGRLKSNAMADAAESDGEIDEGSYVSSNFDQVVTTVKTMFTNSESFKTNTFDPEQIQEASSSCQNLAKQSYRAHTVWHGNRFQSLKTELNFLNEHAVLNKLSVFFGYALQLMLIIFAVCLNFFMIHFGGNLCDREPMRLREACRTIFNASGRLEVKQVTGATGAFAFVMVIIGIFANWYIHRSEKIVNKAWAMVAASIVYTIELIGVCFMFVFLQDGDVFWSLKMAYTFTGLFLIALWYNGQPIYQVALFTTITLGIFYGLSIPLAMQLHEDFVDPNTSEDVTSASLIEYTLYTGSAPITAVFCIIALVSSYVNENTARMRFLERLLLAHQQNNVIRQKSRNEHMQKTFLENMLPTRIVNKLQAASFSVRSFQKLSQRCQGVSILFADIAGFSSFATQVDSAAVMSFLNEVFMHFDDLCDQHHVYKVETVGDCYVAAVGVVTGKILAVDTDQDYIEGNELQSTSQSNTKDMVSFGKAMIRASRSVMKPKIHAPALVRVGIHTGPCMSGIVGTKNMRYCLFGDTINTAARMEQSGVVDFIQASHAVATLTPDESWEPRGSIAVKGMGSMETFLLRISNG